MRRLRHAAALTFVVYVAVTVLALVPAFPSALALPSVDTDRWGGMAWLEALDEAGPALRATVIATLPVLVLGWLLSPLLQMAWLSSLLRPRSVAQALALGVRGYWRAVGVSLILLMVFGVAVGLLVTAPLAGHLVLEGSPDARTHDLTVLALTLPGLFVLGLWAAWHDLARAALASVTERPLGAVRIGFSALRPATVGLYLILALVAGGLGVLGHLTGFWLRGPDLWRGSLVMVVAQLLALGSLAVRGAWLGAALDAVLRPR